MQDFSFDRSKRLLNGPDFQHVFDHNKARVSHPRFLMLAATTDLGHPRLGLVISKKNCRKAVDRNRIKRVVRETFRLAQTELASLDVVFLARKGLDQLDPAEQTRLLRDSWQRLASSKDRKNTAKKKSAGPGR